MKGREGGVRSRKGLGAWGQAVGTGREGEILSTRVCVGGGVTGRREEERESEGRGRGAGGREAETEARIHREGQRK